MRDAIAGIGTAFGLYLLTAGLLNWREPTGVISPSHHENGTDISRVGLVFLRFWGAAMCFATGSLTLTFRLGRGKRVVALGAENRCSDCRQAIHSTCKICGATYCPRHGGLRWCWFSEPDDDGISLSRRHVCDHCTPNSLRLGWSIALAGLFMLSGTAGLVYGWLRFPIL